MSADIALYEDIFQESLQTVPKEKVDEFPLQEKSVLLKTINELANENRKLQKDGEICNEVIKKLEEEKNILTHNFKGLVIVSRREIKRLTMKETFLLRRLKRHGLYAPAGIKKSNNRFQSLEDIPVCEEIEYSTLLDCIRSNNEFKEEKDARRHRLNDSYMNKVSNISSPPNLSDSVQKESAYPEVKSTEELIKAVDNILDSTAYQVIDYLMRHRKTAEEWFKKNNTRFATDGKNLMLNKDDRALRSINAFENHNVSRNSEKTSVHKEKDQRLNSDFRDSSRSSSVRNSKRKPSRENSSGRSLSNQKHSKHSSYQLCSPRNNDVCNYSQEHLSPVCRSGKLNLLAKTPPSAEDEDVENNSEQTMKSRSSQDTSSKMAPRPKDYFKNNCKDSKRPLAEKFSSSDKKSSFQYSKRSSFSEDNKRHKDDNLRSSHCSKSSKENDYIHRKSSKSKEDSSPRNDSRRSNAHPNRNSNSPCSHQSRISSFYGSKDECKGKEVYSNRFDSTTKRNSSSERRKKNESDKTSESSRFSSQYSSKCKSVEKRNSRPTRSDAVSASSSPKSASKSPYDKKSTDSKSTHCGINTKEDTKLTRRKSVVEKVSKSPVKSQNSELEEKGILDSDLEIVSYWSDSSYTSSSRHSKRLESHEKHGRMSGSTNKSDNVENRGRSHSDKIGNKTKIDRKDASVSCLNKYRSFDHADARPEKNFEKKEKSYSFKKRNMKSPDKSDTKQKASKVSRTMSKVSSTKNVERRDNFTGLEDFESRLLVLYDNSMKQVRENHHTKKQLSSLTGHIPTEQEKQSINEYYDDLEEKLCAESCIENEEDEEADDEVPIQTTLFTKRMRDKLTKKSEISDLRSEVDDADLRAQNDFSSTDIENVTETLPNKGTFAEKEIEEEIDELLLSPEITLERGLKWSDNELDDEQVEETVNEIAESTGAETLPENIDINILAGEIVIDETDDLDAEEGEILESEESQSDAECDPKSVEKEESHSHKKVKSDRHSVKNKSSSKSSHRKKTNSSNMHRRISTSTSHNSGKVQNDSFEKNENKKRLNSRIDTERHTKERRKSGSTSRKNSKERKRSSSKSRQSQSSDKRRNSHRRHPNLDKPNSHSVVKKSVSKTINSEIKTCHNGKSLLSSKSSISIKRRLGKQPVLRSVADYSDDGEKWESDLENHPVDDTIVKKKNTSHAKSYRKRNRSRSSSVVSDRPGSKICRI